MTEMKKASTGRLLNMSIDRKRKMLSTILFKAIGMSVDLDRSEDPHDTTAIKTFLNAMSNALRASELNPEVVTVKLAAPSVASV